MSFALPNLLNGSIHARQAPESSHPGACACPTMYVPVVAVPVRQRRRVGLREDRGVCVPGWFPGWGNQANHQGLRDVTVTVTVTVPYFLVSRIPGFPTRPPRRSNVSLHAVFHTAAAHLGLELPWPIPGRFPAARRGTLAPTITRVSGAPARAWASAPCRPFLRRWGCYTSCSRRRERQARGVSSFFGSHSLSPRTFKDPSRDSPE